ncbi:hypothetical protein M2271_001245 [Streptomyces sp. LBL]|uniref:hypothetical protein n=1 Tax=Streptomyces sp. LBL TaxID=2940562 RepID=UPI0024768935|nr:hypothetical protein [Streptomyces sp. LBL]MDH6623458.1 hypothetical protein [Streptomyces sp. LBL]
MSATAVLVAPAQRAVHRSISRARVSSAVTTAADAVRGLPGNLHVAQDATTHMAGPRFGHLQQDSRASHSPAMVRPQPHSPT